MSITGTEVRSAREALGYTRVELAEQTGLKNGAIARIESKGPRPDEIDAVKEILVAAGIVSDDAIVNGELVVEHDDRGGTITYAWRGLKRGQVVRVQGIQRERFKFGYHYESPTQEYVGLYSLRNGAERCIIPERIRDQRGRKLT